MSSTSSSEKDISEEFPIIEVYSHNFVQEIKRLSALLEEFNYVGMDTEFPGTVYGIDSVTEDFYYRYLKNNVDSLKLIQIGLTLSNSKGEHPKGTYTWQFNLKFDNVNDTCSYESFNLLSECGIDFEKLKTNGISHQIFAEYLMTSGLVLNPDINWISFHGAHDFGYILRLLLGTPLPEKEKTFTEELALYFPNHYDIKVITQGNEKLQGGLNRLARCLDVNRIGKVHQAGSDSFVTIELYFKLLKEKIVTEEDIETYKNVIFGLGDGADDSQTLGYIKIGNEMNFYNKNCMIFMPYVNGINSSYVNIPLNSNSFNKDNSALHCGFNQKIIDNQFNRNFYSFSNQLNTM